MVRRSISMMFMTMTMMMTIMRMREREREREIELAIYTKGRQVNRCRRCKAKGGDGLDNAINPTVIVF